MATEGTGSDKDAVVARATYDLAPRLKSVLEAADALGVSRWTIYKAVKRGQLRSVRIGDRLLFTVDDLRAYVEANRR